jgi:hypothetical protein
MQDRCRSHYPWMATAAFAVIVVGKILLPFPGQQRAQNISLAVEAIGGATLGFWASRLLGARKPSK